MMNIESEYIEDEHLDESGSEADDFNDETFDESMEASAKRVCEHIPLEKKKEIVEYWNSGITGKLTLANVQHRLV